MKEVLGQRNFALIWLGSAISVMGSWALNTALPFYVFDETGSALIAAIVLVANMAPGIMLGSLAGVLVDRWDYKRIMVGVNLLQAGIVLITLLALSSGWIWITFVVTFLLSACGKFLRPAENALIPLLVHRDNLLTANALNAISSNIGRLAGPPIGGVLLALWGLQVVIVLNSLSLLAAALLIASVERPARISASVVGAAETTAVSRWIGFWRNWLDGLKLVVATPLLSALFVVIGVARIFDGALYGLWVPFIDEVLGGDAAIRGWVLTAQGVGGIAGGMFVGHMTRHLQSRQVLAVSLYAGGLITIVMASFPSVGLTIMLGVLFGPIAVAEKSSRLTLLQGGTPESFRGRVFGAADGTISLLSVIGVGMGALLADVVGTEIVLIVAGLIGVASGLLAHLLLIKQRTP